ncbi:L-threonylcarbamoyladenylate synthase [Acanthopleuribacter pedis]|uniref:Threonylcarbamoyl-AMP synthase n=1 Tax=Acanthopleuribacter pedis TaxID=442870 RepID=A0A8J7U1S3_9BACT|nr:L-threonylcarbamoyladenylate synthase [Acanthopleuribacter pedis]MBO1316979.1 threonylcarbamoyl-AMP synthase [Acanthopleuribacter pedis]
MTFETRLHVIDQPSVDHPAIAEAAALLQAGSVVAFPTETVYGLGADCTSAAAVARIYVAKNRPNDNPVIVHVAERDQLSNFCIDTDERVSILAKAFWPGPLTLILKAKPHLRDTVCRGLDTVGIRVPAHPTAFALLKKSGLGLAAPSANISGKPSPTKAKHVWNDLNGRIPMILDGGPCRVGIESTVLDLSQPQAAVLRPGWITGAQLDEVLGSPVTREADLKQAHRSPGTRYRHYSPDAALFVLAPDVGDAAFNTLQHLILKQKGTKLGYIGTRRHLVTDAPSTHFYGDDGVDSLIHDLYMNLRQMDEEGVSHILIDGCGEVGHGRSLMDRLRRAATVVLVSDQDVTAFCLKLSTEWAIDSNT